MIGSGASQSEARDAVTEFNRGYYTSLVWQRTTWLGVPVLKSPTDLWIYQEILAEQRPDVIIEAGTYHGGSALFLASICDLLGHGQVVTIDLAQYESQPHHTRITYLHGSSIDPDVIEQVRSLVPTDSNCLVILDSDHRRDHVLQELRAYAHLVKAAGYIIVEDTNINGHPVLPEYGPGPMEAVEAFLIEHPSFEADLTRQKFGLTFNPGGYLRRVR